MEFIQSFLARSSANRSSKFKMVSNQNGECGRRIASIFILGFSFSLVFADQGFADGKGVYLNGVDISGARSEDLKNVAIHIDEQGNIFITAPQYQVQHGDTYVPLGEFNRKNRNTPTLNSFNGGHPNLPTSKRMLPKADANPENAKSGDDEMNSLDKTPSPLGTPTSPKPVEPPIKMDNSDSPAPKSPTNGSPSPQTQKPSESQTARELSDS